MYRLGSDELGETEELEQNPTKDMSRAAKRIEGIRYQILSYVGRVT